MTLIETMVALSILAILLAVGIPSMRQWTFVNQVAGAAQFYSEGFIMARNQALSNNSASRLVLTENRENGQMDWQVDICFPTSDTPCTAVSENWSTVERAATDDVAGASGFKSVLRPASSLPQDEILALAVEPEGARTVHFTPLGWVDTNVPNRIERIDLKPVGSYSGATPRQAVVLTLAGITTRCKPEVLADDPQRCPP